MSKSKNIHGSLVECKCVGWRKNDLTRSARLERTEGETSYDRGKGYSAYQRAAQGETEPRRISAFDCADVSYAG